MSQTLARFIYTSRRRLTSSSLILPKCTHSSAASAITHRTPSPPSATHHLRRPPLPYSLSHAGASFRTSLTATRWLHSYSAGAEMEGEEEMTAPPAGAGCSDSNQHQLPYYLVVMDNHPSYQQIAQNQLFRDSFVKMVDLLHRIPGAKKKKNYFLDFYVRGDQVAFGCKINTETASKLKGMPEVANVIDCNSEPASLRGGHSDMTTDLGLENKQALPYWLIRMGQPCGEELTEQQRVDFSMMKLVPILDSLLNKYSLDILINEDEVAFGCEISEETATKLKGVPGVVDVCQSPRTHSAACHFEFFAKSAGLYEMLDNSSSDEEMADFEPLPQFPSSFSDFISDQHKKLHHWFIFKEKPRDRVLTTEREIVEYSLQTLSPVLFDGVRREKGAAPKGKLELAFYLCDNCFVFGLDMEDESASKLKGMPGVLSVIREGGDHYEKLQYLMVKEIPYCAHFKTKFYVKSEQNEGLFTLDRYVVLTIGSKGGWEMLRRSFSIPISLEYKMKV
ncbi:unnamed protein product [Linum tenue]|uniref:MORF/ORRM1/DAG-like MORF domain-containing protein n=2 Tax=Linum tenue TaxID=586396 RepID=A0AAV0I893_9ROSI|nr:unnamed protein product [Linum tenue]